jgi:hypothetical protein
VPATARAGQRHWDVVITWPCFVRRLAQPIIAAQEPSLRQVNLKKYWKRCQWAPMPRYPSHIASNAAIYWMLFGLRCWVAAHTRIAPHG